MSYKFIRNKPLITAVLIAGDHCSNRSWQFSRTSKPRSWNPALVPSPSAAPPHRAAESHFDNELRGSLCAPGPTPPSARPPRAGFSPPPRRNMPRGMVTAKASSLCWARRRPSASRNNPASFHIRSRSSLIHFSVAASPVGGPEGSVKSAFSPTSPAGASAIIVSATSAPNTSPSSSELLASRFAPCTPVQAASPAAYSRRNEVRPCHRPHATHHVMRRRSNRDQVPPQLQPATCRNAEIPGNAPSDHFFTWRISRWTGSPSIPSRVMARATTSRGASSSSG